MNLSAYPFLIAVMLLGLGNRLHGHGEVHTRINLLTADLAREPTNTSLYVQRSELYRVDGDYTNALADLDKAMKIDPALPRGYFFRGRALSDASRPQEALVALNTYLAPKPRDGDAYTTRARVLNKLGSYQPAAEDYTTAIGIGTSGPELFIERADAWRSMGKLDDAIRSLDEGIRKMGPLVTLQLPAIELEVRAKRYDAALARIDAVSARLQRKEMWLFRRAEILRQAGREAEAKKSYQDALVAIDRLPPTHRRTRVTVELETRIRMAMETNAPVAKARAL